MRPGFKFNYGQMSHIVYRFKAVRRYRRSVRNELNPLQ